MEKPKCAKVFDERVFTFIGVEYVVGYVCQIVVIQQSESTHPITDGCHHILADTKFYHRVCVIPIATLFYEIKSFLKP